MSATKAGKRPLRSLTPMEKLSAISRVSVGGESKASVARDIGVPESTLRGWCKNHEKISYQVRTVSSPEGNTDEPPENITIMPKRMKLEPPTAEQPYNLSMKSSDISNGSYSPQSDHQTIEGEYAKPPVAEREANTSPLNLRKTMDSPPSSEKTVSSHSEKERQQEKNKAELAKLSAELGLNRPEVNVKSVLNQWKNMINFCQQQQQQLQHSVPITKTSPPINERHVSPLSNGLLTTVDKRDKMQYPHNLEQTPSVFDSVSYWLRQQSYANSQAPFLPLVVPSTSSSTNGTNTATSTANGDASSTFLSADSAAQMRIQWGLYQHNAAYQVAQLQAAAAAAAVAASGGQVSPGQPGQAILYQQLTKESSSEREVNCENKTKEDNKPKNGTKNRSVLDNLLLNNNKVCSPKKEDVESLNAFEALDHGEKFLSWLEHCSDPAVTSLQLHTVQSLIKNLKNAFERRTDPNRNRNRRK